MNTPLSPRTIGFFGATGIGIGAMVGGGILALAGVAFAVSGPSAILAFMLNGLIALVTALSFAEMAAANPQSGGTYTYAKKALTVQTAFGVGWVVWFASLVAAVLYALGFGAFATFAIQQFPIQNEALHVFVQGHSATVILALSALAFYTYRLTRSTGSGGAFANIGKLAVFAILIAGGLAVMIQTPFSQITSSLDPFFSGGFSGVIAAMGYTFIALQGFDLIASAAGEIKNPERTIPRAMVATILVGLGIYIPLLFVVSTIGVTPGEHISVLSADNPETVIALAAQEFLGAFGFWLVLVAGIFSMLSALQANVFAGSRIALSMAKDRTLSHHLSVVDPTFGTPNRAIYATALIIALLVLALPNVAAAGAASSLIFLLTFALAHIIMMLMRKRSFEDGKTFRVPFFPVLPILGMVACFALAGFQAIAVPAAGLIALMWLLAGVVLYLVFFVNRATVFDASDEALNPDILRLRGLSPLVLMPIANPANAESMVFVANALAPPVVGRVLLLSIVIPTDEEHSLTARLDANRDAMQQALRASFDSGLRPDALTTIANEPWQEIARVIKVHQCRSVLLGLSNFSDLRTSENLEHLVREVKCDVVVFRQPFSGWKINEANKILIPVAGFASHDALRARVAASLWRVYQPDITFLQIMPGNSSKAQVDKQMEKLTRFAGRMIPGKTESKIILSDDVKSELIEQTRNHDLVIMGLGPAGTKARAFGSVPMALAEETNTALIFISKNSA
ncbi:MAG: amino acid permease [Balneolales bacterium]|nr:amino acid permease [Balneolales bacterium]